MIRGANYLKINHGANREWQDWKWLTPVYWGGQLQQLLGKRRRAGRTSLWSRRWKLIEFRGEWLGSTLEAGLSWQKPDGCGRVHTASDEPLYTWKPWKGGINTSQFLSHTQHMLSGSAAMTEVRQHLHHLCSGTLHWICPTVTFGFIDFGTSHFNCSWGWDTVLWALDTYESHFQSFCRSHTKPVRWLLLMRFHLRKNCLVKLIMVPHVSHSSSKVRAEGIQSFVINYHQGCDFELPHWD